MYMTTETENVNVFFSSFAQADEGMFEEDCSTLFKALLPPRVFTVHDRDWKVTVWACAAVSDNGDVVYWRYVPVDSAFRIPGTDIKPVFAVFND